MNANSKKIVAAVPGMHVSPAKQTVAMRDYQENVITGQTQRTKWSLCAAMLRRPQNKTSVGEWIPVPYKHGFAFSGFFIKLMYFAVQS